MRVFQLLVTLAFAEEIYVFAPTWDQAMEMQLMLAQDLRIAAEEDACLAIRESSAIKLI